jgi:phage shock protein PspC (stress-responsive transcriptional regulator)/ElaB/YqjD/DUF883 family membrane-anchored ribosome-binding protein
MKKIININFQGRVIPIEETAYDTLKQYVESLRRYFSNEEGRDEIINDIESRIAELFSERLKRGSACITDEDVNAVMSSIGRPQDFEQEEGSSTETSNGNNSYQQAQPQTIATGPNVGSGRGRLYRNADDKILGGVCSGLANYLGIDPVILRILFVLLIAPLFWVYILLWIIVPSQSLSTNITKRLYRNPDDKIIAGVCGGLASYFNIDRWIPRLIFALPLIIAIISGSIHALWWDYDYGFMPRIVTGSLSSTLFITYIILWIAVPFANTASEKLEMRGEKVDLNSIRNTVKEDLENFKTKAEKWGQEVKQTAQEFGSKAAQYGQTAGTQARNFASEAAPIARNAGSGIGHVIGILFKAFFLFIAGIIALSLFGVLIGLLFGGMAVFPLKNFIFEGSAQNILAWGTIILFLGVPLVALITWLVRRIMSVRSGNHYLGYIFAGLWVVGLLCFVFLVSSLIKNFKTRVPLEDQISLSQPAANKMIVDVKNSHLEYLHGEWFGARFNDDLPVIGENLDTLMLNNVKIKIFKSKDSAYHLTRVRLSRGNTREAARKTAGNIQFNIEQRDSLLLLPAGFAVSEGDKFRNQQVMLILEVPVGKRIILKDAVHRYSWYNINYRSGFNEGYDEPFNEGESWDDNTEYIMSPDGLKKISELDPIELKKGSFKIIVDDKEGKVEIEGNSETNDGKYHYHYKQSEGSKKENDAQKPTDEQKKKDSIEREKKLKEVIKTSGVNKINTEKSFADEPLIGTNIFSPILGLLEVVN